MKDANQPDPTPNNLPAVWDLVIQDMRERDALGLKEYGTRLQPFNGRDALLDAYMDGLDKVVYLRQEIEERKMREQQSKDGAQRFFQLAENWLASEGDAEPARTLKRLLRYMRKRVTPDTPVFVDARPIDADQVNAILRESQSPGQESSQVETQPLAKKPEESGLAKWLRDQYGDETWTPTVQQAKELFREERQLRHKQAQELAELRKQHALQIKKLKDETHRLTQQLSTLQYMHGNMLERLEELRSQMLCAPGAGHTVGYCPLENCPACQLTRIMRGGDPKPSQEEAVPADPAELLTKLEEYEAKFERQGQRYWALRKAYNALVQDRNTLAAQVNQA